MRVTLFSPSPAPVDEQAAAVVLAWFKGMAAARPPALGPVTHEAAQLLVASRVGGPALATGATHPLLTAAAKREFLRVSVLEAESVAVAGLLASEGVPCAIVKGGPLAHRFWPSETQRDMADVDVLVSPAGYARAAAALEEAGYLRRDSGQPGWYLRRWSYHECFVKDEPPVLVELHWDLVRPGLAKPTADLALDEAVHTRIGPGDVPTLSDPWHLLAVAVHALHETFGLRQLLDVALIARSLDDDGWERARAAARRTGLTAALYHALALAADRLEVPYLARVAALRPPQAQEALVGAYLAAVPSVGRPGRTVLQLHHVMTPLLHCRGARCLTQLPRAMLLDRGNIATDLQRLLDRLQGLQAARKGIG